MMYSQDSLRKLKYIDLLRTAKDFGIKRQKTEKLIGSILKAQELSLSNEKDDGKIDGARESDELLINVDQPDLSFDINLSTVSTKSDSLNKSEVSLKDSSIRVEALSNLSATIASDVENESRRSIRRSGTFSINREANRGKRKLSPKSQSSCNEEVISSPSKKRRTSQAKYSGRSGGKRKSISASEENLSCSEVQSSKDIEALLTEEKETSPQPILEVANDVSFNSGRKSLRGRLLVSRLSNVRRRSNTVVPTVGVEAPAINKRRKSQASPLVSNSSSSSNEQPVLDRGHGSDLNPRSVATNEYLVNSLRRKPTFTLGRSPSNQEKDKSSGIPRFVAYARKMKMPDFNKIHKSAFKKMEALDDYVERKNTSSAVKKSIAKKRVEPAFKPSITKVEEVKIDFSDKGKIEFGQCLQRFTPRTSNHFKRNSITSATASVVRNSTAIFSEKMEKDRLVKPKSPMNQGGKKMSSIARRHLATKGKINVKASALPRLVKENIPFRVAGSKWSDASKPLNPGSFQRRKEYKPDAIKNATGNYKPYVGAIRRDKSMNRAVLKDMVQKNPKVKQSGELRNSQKMYIKGVRTNKRFELQMANRGIQVK